MADLSTLTLKQREIYDFISQHIDRHGYPPTVRDIGVAFEIESPNGVMCHLNALVKKGAITRKDKSARAIQLVDHKPAASPPAHLPLTAPLPAPHPTPADPPNPR